MKAVFWALVIITAAQLVAGLVVLYLWGFALVEVPKDAATPLLFGPLISGAGAGFLWEER